MAGLSYKESGLGWRGEELRLLDRKEETFDILIVCFFLPLRMFKVIYRYYSYNLKI